MEKLGRANLIFYGKIKKINVGGAGKLFEDYRELHNCIGVAYSIHPIIDDTLK